MKELAGMVAQQSGWALTPSAWDQGVLTLPTQGDDLSHPT